MVHYPKIASYAKSKVQQLQKEERACSQIVSAMPNVKTDRPTLSFEGSFDSDSGGMMPLVLDDLDLEEACLSRCAQIASTHQCTFHSTQQQP